MQKCTEEVWLYRKRNTVSLTETRSDYSRQAIHQNEINFKSCPATGKKGSSGVEVRALQFNEVKIRVENKQ